MSRSHLVGPPVSLFSLPELAETAARLQRQARELANRAGRACLVARQFQDLYQAERVQRQSWATLLASIPLDPDHVVILCASCHRVRGALGWTILPAGIEDRLMTWGRALVSHGFCPACLRNQLLTGWPAIEASASR